MKQEREGIIYALMTPEEKAEVARPEMRQWYCTGDDHTVGAWEDDDGTCHDADEPDPCIAYRPRPKLVKKYRPWTPEEAVGKIISNKNTNTVHMIISSVGGKLWIGGVFEPYDEVNAKYTQIDGSPCGVEVDNA